MLILLMTLHSASAEETAILEEIEYGNLQKYAEGVGFDFIRWVQRGISGDFRVDEWIRTLFDGAEALLLNDIRLYGTAILVPGMVMMIPRLVVPQASATKYAVSFACRLCCVSTLAACFSQARIIACELLNVVVDCSDLMVPVMIAATTLSGADTAAMFLTPMSGMITGIIQNLLQKWEVTLSSAAAIVAIAGNLSENVRLKRLSELIRRFLHWSVGGLIGGFTIMLTLQGKLSAGRDSAATRTARYAIENLVPVIGGNISDSLDSLLAAATNVKNAIGASGLMLLASVCIGPVLRMLGIVMMLKLCSAVLEPVGDERLTSMIGQFGDSLEMLAIISLAAVSLAGLLLAGCMSSAQTLIR